MALTFSFTSRGGAKMQLEELSVALAQIGDRALQNGARKLGQEAEKVQQLAKDYVPVEDHDVENAILINKGVGSNRRVTYTVYVDGDAPADEANMMGRLSRYKTVGEYALWLHESDYTPGLKSQEKAAALGVMVGPKYMERASQERASAVQDSVFGAVQEIL